MKLIYTTLLVSVASVYADVDSYKPPKADGGPYPAAGVPASAFRPRPSTPAATYPPPKTTTYVPETEPTTEPITSPKPEPLSENLGEYFGQQTDNGIYYILLPDGRLQKITYTTMPLKETPSRLQEAERLQGAETRRKAAKIQTPAGYVANVKYQDVEPVNGPVYAYNSAPLVRIYK